MRNKNKKQTLLKFCFISKTKKNYIAARSTMLKYFFVCVLIKYSLVRRENSSERLMYRQVRMGYFALRLPCPDWKVRPPNFSKEKHNGISYYFLHSSIHFWENKD